MQLLSAYLLESPNLSESELTARFGAVHQEISSWLKGKGVSEPNATAGDFESKTEDGSGGFSREQVAVHDGRLEEVRLEEFTRAGQIFTTYLAAAAYGHRLRVYCTLNVANAESVVSRLPVDPRCPSIIRTLLTNFADWHLNSSPLPSPRSTRLMDEAGGRQIADAIRASNRSLPIIAVSEIEGEPVWPALADELAFDLAGLANVVLIDDEAAWALTDELGKTNSCYRGAVRLYWPPHKRENGEFFFNSTVWTASALLSNDGDGKGANRFRSTLRRTLMSAAALSITPPSAIREIQNTNSRLYIEDLERRADPNSEELATARKYIKENQELKTKVEHLQEELAKISARAEIAEHALNQLKSSPSSVQEEEGGLTESPEPAPGDVRFYKKIHSKGAYDVLVEVGDCGHTSWQAANKADKAKKGLERLLGRNDWKGLQHCGTCTGGGMWKVRW